MGHMICPDQGVTSFKWKSDFSKMIKNGASCMGVRRCLFPMENEFLKNDKKWRICGRTPSPLTTPPMSIFHHFG